MEVFPLPTSSEREINVFQKPPPTLPLQLIGQNKATSYLTIRGKEGPQLAYTNQDLSQLPWAGLCPRARLLSRRKKERSSCLGSERD
jgi:hypothetical protein